MSYVLRQRQEGDTVCDGCLIIRDETKYELWAAQVMLRTQKEYRTEYEPGTEPLLAESGDLCPECLEATREFLRGRRKA